MNPQEGFKSLGRFVLMLTEYFDGEEHGICKQLSVTFVPGCVRFAQPECS